MLCWAERAVFQFHPVGDAATPVVRTHPRLELSVADLFHPRTIAHPQFVNALPESQASVSNALSRIVHGGWDVAHQTISQIHTYVVENDMSGFKDKNTKGLLDRGRKSNSSSTQQAEKQTI